MKIDDKKYLSTKSLFKPEKFSDKEKRFFNIVYLGQHIRILDKRIYVSSLIMGLQIEKLEDDWYLVSIDNSQYYKCDGFDELKNTLKSIPLGDFDELKYFIMDTLMDNEITNNQFSEAIQKYFMENYSPDPKIESIGFKSIHYFNLGKIYAFLLKESKTSRTGYIYSILAFKYKKKYYLRINIDEDILWIGSKSFKVDSIDKIALVVNKMKEIK